MASVMRRGDDQIIIIAIAMVLLMVGCNREAHRNLSPDKSFIISERHQGGLKDRQDYYLLRTDEAAAQKLLRSRPYHESDSSELHFITKEYSEAFGCDYEAELHHVSTCYKAEGLDEDSWLVFFRDRDQVVLVWKG